MVGRDWSSRNKPLALSYTLPNRLNSGEGQESGTRVFPRAGAGIVLITKKSHIVISVPSTATCPLS